MSTAFTVLALDSTLRIELDSSVAEGTASAIRSQWLDLSAPQNADPTIIIRAGIGRAAEFPPTSDVREFVATTESELLQRLTTEVTLGAIGALRGEALMLHASAIALADGRVIGFVGPSGRGKTTAAQALGGAYRYVTDETLAIRPDGSVIAYPKPLAIGRHPSPKQITAASSLGLTPADSRDLQLAALVLLDRQPGYDDPVVEAVPLTEALAELAPQTSYLSTLEHPLRTIARIVGDSGGVRRVRYTEASTLLSVVDAILAAGRPESPHLTDVDAAYRRDCDCYGEPISDTIVRPGSYQRTNQVDALLVDGELMVLVGYRVFVLNELGAAIWLSADLLLLDEIVEIVLGQLADPPPGVDPREIVEANADELVKAGLLLKRR